MQKYDCHVSNLDKLCNNICSIRGSVLGKYFKIKELYHLSPVFLPSVLEVGIFCWLGVLEGGVVLLVSFPVSRSERRDLLFLLSPLLHHLEHRPVG